MTTASKLVKSSMARTLHTVVAAIVAFFMMPFLVRTLGERSYGIWVVIGGLVSNYYLLDFGLVTAISRFLAGSIAQKDVEATNVVVNTALFVYSCLSVLIIILTVGLSLYSQAWFRDAPDIATIRLVILIIGIQFAAEFPVKAFAGIMSSHLRYDLLIWPKLATLALSTTLIVYFVGHGAGILALALISLTCELISDFVYFLTARRLFPEMTFSWRYVRRGVLGELIRFSSWAFVTQMANQVRFKVDSLVIVRMLSAVAVTHYTVALRLVEYFAELVYRATNLTTPVFTQYYVNEQHEEIREKFLFMNRISAVLAIFGGGMIVIVGRSFILRWMGPSFEVAYPVLVVLMISMATELIGTYSDNLFYVTSSHRDLALINLSEAVLNVVCSILLAGPYGILGVAIGTAGPLLFFRVIVIPWRVSRLIGLPLQRYYLNLIPTSGFTLGYLGLCYWIARPFLATPSYLTVLAVGLAATPLYLAAVPFVAFSRAERAYLFGVARRATA